MKMMFKIAKTELRNLFYSPVAWFLAIAFMVQCAYFYTSALYGSAKFQDLLLKNNPAFKDFGPTSLTKRIFLGPDGIFANASNNLYLFVPLLSMALINREINNGSIKLLYSSPVRLREIVFGKYLAVMAFNGLLLLILGLFMALGVFNIRLVDSGMLLSAALGFYLLVCAYSAIGLFMSSLTTYQIVSAVGSFIIIFVLSRIGGLWQKIDFVRDLTYFLSLSGRTVKLVEGLITTKDVLYFIIIVGMFLSFTLLRLKGARASAPWYVRARDYVLVMIAALGLGYLSSRPRLTLYWDATAHKDNTIHPRTQEVIKELGNDPLEVTLYTNILGSGALSGLPERRNDYLSKVWEPYVRFKPDISFNYVNYYDYDASIDEGRLRKTFPRKSVQQIAEQMTDVFDEKIARFETPAAMHKKINLLPENYRLVMQLTYKGRSTFLRTFDDNIFWPEEMHIAAAFKRLLQARMPKILFVTGDLERNIFKKGEREYRLHATAKDFRYSMINLGFDADTISLAARDIPADITALVLADPKTTLSAIAIEKINRYLAGGGNMLILGEPGKQDLLNPLLQPLGVQLTNGILVELSKDEMPNMIKPSVTAVGSDLAEEKMLLNMKNTGDTPRVLMPGATGIAWSREGVFKISPLLLTSNKTWLKPGRLVTDSAPPVFDPQAGDVKGSFPTAVAMTRQVGQRQQRIVVCSDADFMSSLRNGGDFMGRAIYCWLDEGKFPIYTPRPNPKDNLLTISSAGVDVLKIVFVWLLPAIALMSGIILLVRRKRK